MGMGYCNKSIMLGRGPAPGVELRVAIQVVRRRLGDEFREPAESELSAGVTSPPVSGVRGLPLTPTTSCADGGIREFGVRSPGAR